MRRGLLVLAVATIGGCKACDKDTAVSKPNIGGFDWFKKRGHTKITVTEGWGATHKDWEKLAETGRSSRASRRVRLGSDRDRRKDRCRVVARARADVRLGLAWPSDGLLDQSARDVVEGRPLRSLRVVRRWASTPDFHVPDAFGTLVLDP